MTRWRRIFPGLALLRHYRRNDLGGDLAAGVTVAVMLVPQGMAYALLAGMPPVTGLYASVVPLAVYALFGSSRHLAVGPVAMVSLLVHVGVSRLAESGTAEYLSLVLLLTLMVGALKLAFGLLGMGFLLHFVSRAAIGGFTSAAAILILFSQLRHLLGVPLPTDPSALRVFLALLHRLGDIQPLPLAIGLGSLAVLFLGQRLSRHFPGPLLVVILATFGAWYFRLDQLGLATVGIVPQGLPPLSLPALTPEAFVSLLPTALTIVFVGYMESLAVAEAMAAKDKYRIDPNQEFRALGLANLAGTFFSSFPVAGGFSRTAVNHQAGARSPLASLLAASFVLLTLLLLTPLFRFLPNAALAAIIIVAVAGLIEFRELRHLLCIKRTDGYTFLLTFFFALVLGIEEGILLGVAFSLLVFIWRSAHPHIAELGYLQQEDVFRNIRRYPQVRTFPGVLLLRVDASIYFANLEFIKDHLRAMSAERPDLRWIVFDLAAVNDMDAVAIANLEEVIANYRQRGIEILFAEVKGPVRDLLERAGWHEKFHGRTEFLSVKHALREIGALTGGVEVGTP